MFWRLLRKCLRPKTVDAKYRAIANRATRDVLNQNHGERLVGEIWWLDAEVSNGSLAQYVVNSTGDTFYETMQYLREIGAVGTEAILQELAAAAFPNGLVPEDRKLRADLFEAWEQKAGSASLVSALTTGFNNTRGDLVVAVVRYAECHPEYFPWLAA